MVVMRMMMSCLHCSYYQMKNERMASLNAHYHVSDRFNGREGKERDEMRWDEM